MTSERSNAPPGGPRPPPREIGAVLAGDFRITGRAYRARLWREDVRAIEAKDIGPIVDRVV
ncbi:hypothetical protein [Phenylobacterium sp.]|uniref:hypothetical protein n=1 Tax=Phenylobacterium sp. TaxID=1871053 RepID=UPI0028A1CE0D|nr:hypothetical protein [Phenylobacterium sp.]